MGAVAQAIAPSAATSPRERAIQPGGPSTSPAWARTNLVRGIRGWKKFRTKVPRIDSRPVAGGASSNSACWRE
jgi:hypothetical protein